MKSKFKDLRIVDNFYQTSAFFPMPLTLIGTLDENGENEDGEVWFYRYSENPDDPNEEPELGFIDSDEEYEAVADAFDEYLDSVEFDEIVEEEE